MIPSTFVDRDRPPGPILHLTRDKVVTVTSGLKTAFESSARPLRTPCPVAQRACRPSARGSGSLRRRNGDADTRRGLAADA